MIVPLHDLQCTAADAESRIMIKLSLYLTTNIVTYFEGGEGGGREIIYFNCKLEKNVLQQLVLCIINADFNA